MRTLLFVVLLSLPLVAQEVPDVTGAAGGSVTGGFAYLQSIAVGPTAAGNTAGVTACTNTNQSCTITLPVATTAKSDMTIDFESLNSTVNTITSAFSCATLTAGVCNAGNAVDTFTLCASSGCNIQNSGHDNVDVVYVAQGVGGANFVTVNVSSDPTASGFDTYFQELLPPKCNGVTCDSSFDASTKCSSVLSCTTTTINATDAMLGALDSAQGITSHNYSIEQTGNLYGLDLTTAPSPAFSVNTGGYWTISIIFFKSGAGKFTPTNTLFSAVNSAPPATNFTATTSVPCTTATCTIAIPSSTAGDGIIIFEFGDKTISSISGRGTWVVPSGANTCNAVSTSLTVDFTCAYTLSASAGAGTITATMSGTCTGCWFGWAEWGRTSGSNVVDVQNATTSVGTTTLSSQALTLNGSTPDVCFYQTAWTGAVLMDGGLTFYPYPGGAAFIGWYNNPQHSTAGMLPNVNGATSPVAKVTLSAAATTSASSGICFK